MVRVCEGRQETAAAGVGLQELWGSCVALRSALLSRGERARYH